MLSKGAIAVGAHVQTQVNLESNDAKEDLGSAPPRAWFALMLVGSTLGIVSAAWQIVERIAYSADPSAASVCEINSVVSCNSVFDQWQSSALGVPNTVISLPVFAVLASAGLAGLLRSRLSRPYLAVLFGLALFMAAFSTWYMQQSAFAMGALCLFCTAGAANVIIAGIGITRVVAAERVLGYGRAGRILALLTRSGADIILWLGLGLIIAAMLYLGLVA